MKSLHQLHLFALRAAGQHCSVDTALDAQALERRWEDEGDSYLTIVLPRLGKALERGLEEGRWPAQEVHSTWVHHRGLPAFMRGFLSRIFDRDGFLLDSPDAQCIWAVRQVCYLTHKVQRACTPEREAAAFQTFVNTDASLQIAWESHDPHRLAVYKKTARRLFGAMFQELDRKIAAWELVPKHGPGAVAERLSQKEKRRYDYWTDRLEAVFPRWRYASNLPIWGDPSRIPISDELPVRVVSVPKTQSTPRIIAIEPSTMQYAQQGLKREIYEWVGRGYLNDILGFRDQNRNRLLAESASVTQSLSTLDLSEASDRVHAELVWAMVEGYPHLEDFLKATRSASADVPGHGVIPLAKYASMGSALTFPIEAMVFTTLALCGIEQTVGTRNPRRLAGVLSVYGDDIIVPQHATENVVDWLEHFGAKVNLRKSFRDGKFRESCGAEFYDGTDVSVERVRSELPSSRSDAAAIAALVDFRNRAYRAGLWSLVSDVDQELESLVDLPITSASRGESVNAFLHSLTFCASTDGEFRYNPELHRLEQRVPVLKARSESFRVDDEAGLLEWFHDALRRDDLVDRFDSQERATSFNIKRRWVSTY